MGVHTSAVSAMNYFFLKTLSGKINNVMINGELAHFLVELAKDHAQLSAESIDEISRELIDGEYFYSQPITDIEQQINETVENLTGEALPTIATFYIKLLIQCGQAEMGEYP